jgi:hypothetical protein
MGCSIAARFTLARRATRFASRISAWAAVSATHLPGEELAATVHGQAVPIGIHSAQNEGCCRALLEIYMPRHGPEWEEFLDWVAALLRLPR